MFLLCVLNSAEYGSSSLFYSSVTAQLIPESLRLLSDLYFHFSQFLFLLVNRLAAAFSISWRWEVLVVLHSSQELQKSSCDDLKDESNIQGFKLKKDLVCSNTVETTLFHHFTI